MTRIIQSESAPIREIRGRPACKTRFFKPIQSDSNHFKPKNTKIVSRCQDGRLVTRSRPIFHEPSTLTLSTLNQPRLAPGCTYLHQLAPTCRKKIGVLRIPGKPAPSCQFLGCELNGRQGSSNIVKDSQPSSTIENVKGRQAALLPHARLTGAFTILTGLEHALRPMFIRVLTALTGPTPQGPPPHPRLPFALKIGRSAARTNSDHSEPIRASMTKYDQV
jgi:hypothetical protein